MGFEYECIEFCLQFVDQWWYAVVCGQDMEWGWGDFDEICGGEGCGGMGAGAMKTQIVQDG